jgi:small-conductance mechanosensitive channel
VKANLAARVTVLLASVITLLSAAGVFLALYWDNNAPYIVVTVGTAAACFFGLLSLTQTSPARWELKEESMRTAIAGTIVVVYLVLVGIVGFFVIGPTELPGITQMMITSFTTVVSLVIVFYFGSSAYVQAQREKNGSGKDGPDRLGRETTATPSEEEKT